MSTSITSVIECGGRRTCRREVPSTWVTAGMTSRLSRWTCAAVRRGGRSARLRGAGHCCTEAGVDLAGAGVGIRQVTSLSVGKRARTSAVSDM